jgi:L-amino acid N-acyltransferase YncA/putative methionine-R-sulfoxide reductase with GAF domain
VPADETVWDIRPVFAMEMAWTRIDEAERFAAGVRASGDFRWVGVYDVTPDEVILLGFSGAGPPAYPRFSSNAGLTGAAIAAGRPVVANDVASDPRYLTAFASTGSELIVPILDERSRTVGTLDVESDRRGTFGPEDVERLSAFAATMVRLFTEITIRTASPNDAAAFVDLYAPYVENTIVSFEEDVPSVAEMRKRIEATIPWTPWLTALCGGEVIGYAYASKHRERAAYRWSVDTSVYVAERFHGRGVGRRLYEELFRILERQGFRRACAGIALPNDASVGLHRALGFEPVGVYRRIAWKHGAWRDVMWLDREIGHGEAEPPEPTPFSSDDRRRDQPDEG